MEGKEEVNMDIFPEEEIQPAPETFATDDEEMQSASESLAPDDEEMQSASEDFSTDDEEPEMPATDDEEPPIPATLSQPETVKEMQSASEVFATHDEEPEMPATDDEEPQIPATHSQLETVKEMQSALEDFATHDEEPQIPVTDDDELQIPATRSEPEIVTTSLEPDLPDNKSQVLQVMKIVSDKQELSFVEKVHLPENQILHLCNRILPNSVGRQDREVRINFNSLNKKSFPTIGFYGDKTVMAGTLKNIGVVDDLIASKMDQGKLEPGLYVSLFHDVLFVFYWHQGDLLKNASRTEVSCTFIRYVVDLCDDVYICVEDKHVYQALAASAATATHKRRRTERLKIDHVQNSENDVRVSPGFKVNIGRYVSRLSPPEGVVAPKRVSFFAEGYHRCAFLTASYKQTTTHVRRNTEKVKVDALGVRLKELSEQYDLDFTRLSNKDFVLFLEHSKLPEFKDYKDLENSVQYRRNEYRKDGIQSECNMLSDQVLQSFVGVLPEFCSFARYLPEEFKEREGENAANKEILAASAPFEHLERELAAAWGGTPGKHKPLFAGSEIKFNLKNGTALRFVVEKCKSPICFQEYFYLRHIKGGQDWARFMPSTGRRKGPVMAGEPVTLIFWSNTKCSGEGVVEAIQVSDSVIKEWVKPLIPRELLKLSKNVNFLGFLLNSGKLQQTTSFALPVLTKLERSQRHSIEEEILMAFLRSDNNMDQIKSFSMSSIKNFLTAGSLEVIESLFESVKADLSPESKESYLQWKKRLSEFTLDKTSSKVLFSMGTWKNVCSSIYNDGKETFKEKVKAMVMKDLLRLLREKLEKIQEQRFIYEKDSFLTQTKQKLPQNRTMERRMYIESFSVAKPHYRGGLEANMLVASDEEEKPSIKWMTVELAPQKKDLDELNLNSMHVISPSCSNMVELVSCDPETEDLKKVAFLRTGELLVFIHDKRENSLNLYMTPKLGPLLHGSNPIGIFRRGFDLVSFDEHTRFLALYDAQLSKVRIYKFDQSFRHIDWTGIDISLENFSGSTTILWMQCIPGKSELLLVDDTNRARVVELHQRPLMKPRQISLSSDFVNACISGDGSFLFVFQKNTKPSNCIEEEDHSSANSQQSVSPSKFEIEVYMLGDAMSSLKNIIVDLNVEDATDLQVGIVYFGCQIHLVCYSSVMPGYISSNILTLVSATEVLEFQELSKGQSYSGVDDKDAAGQDSGKSCAALEYIYHIFDKFAVSPALFRGLARDLNCHVLLKSTDITEQDDVQKKCQEYLKLLIGQLEKEKGKDFKNLRIRFQVHKSESWDWTCVDVMLPSCQQKFMGNWIRQLICLVPIQVSRAQNNAIQPLLDGLQIPAHLTYSDSISLANLIRFALYDAVLNQWDGKIKVVSSMGKQSSGKSYLLNHLSGSLLDVAGGRCTDGVWMTIRLHAECLYVLMDFEGLGSFERTEQEDMLLSVLNSAISNLTIFNKKDFHFDKETEAVFQRFQNGVSLVKNDEKLFRGLFYIAIKDVDVSDVKELKDEFRMKLLQICKKSRDNFLTKMYGGMVEIAALPPFTRREYYQESLPDMALTVEELDHSYENGPSFLRDLKLVIAQIAAKDWTPVDVKRIAMKVDIVRRNMDFAVKAGCLYISGVNKVLMNFDTQEEVIDVPIRLGDLLINLSDTGLELAALKESTSNDKILSHLRSGLESVLKRKGISGDQWHSTFQSFLIALIDRRRERVKQWLSSNTAEFAGNDDVQKLQLEAVAALAELKQGLSVCGCKCSVCFWRCAMEKGHSSDHSCMGNHACAEKCTYCSLEPGQGDEVEECRNLAGHEGDHDCKKRNHTCGSICYLFQKSSTCSQSCCLKLGHEGPHKCNSPEHTCNKKCSLESCTNPCVVAIEHGDHERHACHQRFCPQKCIMKGCLSECTKDHFHELTSKEILSKKHFCGNEHACPKDHFHELTSKEILTSKEHLCGNEHACRKDHFHELTREELLTIQEHLCGNEHTCREKCEADGICDILTELVRQKRTFQGKRSSFEYEHVSEQNGSRKECCIRIPGFKQTHEGLHVHTLNPDAVHYCGVRCEACGYFCHLPINHAGLHRTVHGNMRNMNFASERDEFEISGRQYVRGESGIAEMCNMHCKAQGRGHIHLISCPINKNLPCTKILYDGCSRHETRKYGPNEDVPKDELTHETYWKHMSFEDPCTEEDQKEFSLCNHLCRSEEHNESNGSMSKPYCTEKLWHAPAKKSGSPAPCAGYITDDGHVFTCQHSKTMAHHVVFVIDKSGSMTDFDIYPTMAKFQADHYCRLGCVYEAIIRFIVTRCKTAGDDSLSVVLFDDNAVIALEMKEMNENVVDSLLQYHAGGGTNYSSGLILADEVIIRGSKDPSVENKKPTVIFLSDGGNNCGEDPISFVSRMKQMEPRMILHTIMFGTDPTVEVLKKMAASGCGTFQHSLDEVQLQRSFENLAMSLQPEVAALMQLDNQVSLNL